MPSSHSRADASGSTPAPGTHGAARGPEQSGGRRLPACSRKWLQSPSRHRPAFPSLIRRRRRMRWQRWRCLARRPLPAWPPCTRQPWPARSRARFSGGGPRSGTKRIGPSLVGGGPVLLERPPRVARGENWGARARGPEGPVSNPRSGHPRPPPGAGTASSCPRCSCSPCPRECSWPCA